jgi:hypothetical protein
MKNILHSFSEAASRGCRITDQHLIEVEGKTIRLLDRKSLKELSEQ